MKASRFSGNPRIECEPVPITTIADSMGLSTELPLAQISGTGAALLGEDYSNLWVHHVGLCEFSPEPSSGPLFQIGEIRILLLRQRYFYFSDTVLNQSVKESIKLDLISPGFPFFEITWNETDGLRKSLQGLHHFESNNFARDGSVFLRQIARLLRQLNKRGRRPVFLSREEYESALRQAKEQLIALGKPITQATIAEQLGVADERMIRQWNKIFKVKWHEFKHGT